MADEIGGVWRTIGGRRVFIKDGQDLATAMKESGKFNSKSVKKNIDKIKISLEEKFVDSKGNETTFERTYGKEFLEKLKKAKENQPDDRKWRVDDTSHNTEDYDNMRCYTTKNGAVVAITKDGDIVSVCGAKNERGRTLLEYAVKNGGKKLDSYDGNWEVYTHCGFEPVSWCKFEEQFAPNDWKKGRDNPEPIVFFKYTGKPETVKITKQEFYQKVKAAKDYDEAMEIRNKGVR